MTNPSLAGNAEIIHSLNQKYAPQESSQEEKVPAYGRAKSTQPIHTASLFETHEINRAESTVVPQEQNVQDLNAPSEDHDGSVSRRKLFLAALEKRGISDSETQQEGNQTHALLQP